MEGLAHRIFRALSYLSLCGLLTGITACSRWVDFPDHFPNQKSMYNARISWLPSHIEHGYRISGIYINDSYYYLSDLQIEICLLSDTDTCLARQTLFFSRLAVDEVVPFQADMKLPSNQIPQSIRFSYSYLIAEPEMGPSRVYSDFIESFGMPPAP